MDERSIEMPPGEGLLARKIFRRAALFGVGVIGVGALLVKSDMDEDFQMISKDAADFYKAPGVEVHDTVLGVGRYPFIGDDVYIHYLGMYIESGVDGSDGIVFIDTKEISDQEFGIKFKYGAPFDDNLKSLGACPGLLKALASMRAGSERLVVIPPSAGFGEALVQLNNSKVIPPNSTVFYDVQLTRVVDNSPEGVARRKKRNQMDQEYMEVERELNLEQKRQRQEREKQTQKDPEGVLKDDDDAVDNKIKEAPQTPMAGEAEALSDRSDGGSDSSSLGSGLEGDIDYNSKDTTDGAGG
ncbi:hypothetical protein AAMO2058_001185300 [Amorphochlora amoebiformis]